MLVKPPKILYKQGLSRLMGVHDIEQFERYQTFDLRLQKVSWQCIFRGWKGEAWRKAYSAS
jgi:hypothetical protein